MQEHSADSRQQSTPPAPRLLTLPAMLFPSAYVWMIFFSALDVILTALVLTFGAKDGFDPSLEINPIARAIIERWEMAGAMLFKFALVLLTILLCEAIGRKTPRTGRRLAWTGVLISGFPVAWSLALLFSHRLTLFTQ